MNIVLCGSQDVVNAFFVEKIFVDFVASAQWEKGLSLDEIRFIILYDKKGASKIFKDVCDKYGIDVEIYSPKWDDKDEYPQLIRANRYGGSYNAYAAKNRNTHVLEFIGNEQCYVLAVYKLKKDISDFLSKAKKYDNISIREEKIK